MNLVVLKAAAGEQSTEHSELELGVELQLVVHFSPRREAPPPSYQRIFRRRFSPVQSSLCSTLRSSCDALRCSMRGRPHCRASYGDDGRDRDPLTETYPYACACGSEIASVIPTFPFLPLCDEAYAASCGATCAIHGTNTFNFELKCF